MKSKSLTIKQQRFIEEYPIDFNATEAAKRAGYSEKTAYSIGFGLLKKLEIQDGISKQTKKMANKAEVKVEDILLGLKGIAFFDPRRLFDENGKMKPIKDIDDETALAIAGIDISESVDANNEEQFIKAITNKIKQADRIKALELLGKYLNMWIDRVDHTGFNNFAELMSTISKK